MAKKDNKPAAKPKANPMANPATEQMKAVIKAYLDKRAEQDELFRATYAKPNKSIDECCKYIIGEVFKANKIGHANADIWNLAVHYYDEDDIKITPVPANCYGVGVVHTMGEDGRPMRPARPKAPSASKPTPSKGKPAPAAPQKPTTTPPKSTTPTPQKPTQPSKPKGESKPSTTANKPQYTANLFDLWQK